MTGFTRPAFCAYGSDLGHDLFHWHRFARLGAHLIQYPFQFGPGLTPSNFFPKPVGDGFGGEQARPLGALGRRVGQVNFEFERHGGGLYRRRPAPAMVE